MSRDVHQAAEELRADPMFAYLDEDAQLEAARAQLSARGVMADPLEVGICVQLALKQPGATKGRSTRPDQPRRAPPPAHSVSLIGIICDAVPYLHRTIAERLACSRALITAYANQTAAERLSTADLALLEGMLLETRAKIDAVLPLLRST